jgi:hypothetical protein
VNDFTYVATTGSGSTRQIIGDSLGNVFEAGNATDASGYRHWMTRKVTPRSGVGLTIDDFEYVPPVQNYTGDQSIAMDLSGNLYTTGNSLDGSAVSHWFTRMSTNGGASWSILDNYQYVSGQFSTGDGVFVDAGGNLYTMGTGNDAGGVGHWLVKKSTNQGTSWSVSDDFTYLAHGATAFAMVQDSSANLYVAGTANDANASHVLVRKSTNSGQTWSTVDDFQYVSGQNTAVIGHPITIDPSGNIYVSVWGYDSPAHQNWLIRESTNGGQSFATVDHFLLSSTQGSRAQAIGADPFGNVYATGTAIDSSGVNYLITRKTANAGVSWTTTDQYTYPNSTSTSNTQANAIGTDSYGDIVVGGTAYDSSGVGHWVTRMLMCQ